MHNLLETMVGEEDTGKRLDVFLSDACDVSRSAAQQWIADGLVLCNAKKAVKSTRIVAGDCLRIEIPLPREATLEPQDIPIEIVYEDPYLVVVNKPKGMVVHPAAGNPDKTLVNAMLYHCKGQLSGIGGEIRPGIVHRIDKNTSGLLVVTKDDKTHQSLAEQFAQHSIHRVYHAIAHGHFKNSAGTVDANIGRSSSDRKKMAVLHAKGRRAVTHYELLEDLEDFGYLSLKLETGRTHQIRVHMASIGHPLAGDAVYGPKKFIKELQGQCLHAKVLGFFHPVSGKYTEFNSSLPPYFKEYLHYLERKKTS